MAYGARIGGLKVDKEIAYRREAASKLAAARKAEMSEATKLAAETKRPATTSVRAPVAEAPYLPEGLEEGRLGDIMRASPKELETIYERMPEAERPVHLIRGAEETYFSPGTKQEYGDLRTAMTGFKQRPAEATAAGRLSAAIQGQAREQMFEDYDIKTTAMLSPHITRGPEGEELLPGWAQELYNKGKAMSLEDPEGGIRYIEDVLSERERIKAESKDMEEADLMSAAGLDPNTGVPVETSRGAETAEVPGMPRAPRTRTGLSAAATRLRRQYESEQPSPIIGAETLGRFKKAWGRREESPYVRLGR